MNEEIISKSQFKRINIQKDGEIKRLEKRIEKLTKALEKLEYYSRPFCGDSTLSRIILNDHRKKAVEALAATKELK